MCVWVVARLPQRLKSTVFEIFSHSGGSFGAAPLEKKIQKSLILVFEVIVQSPKHTFQITLFSRLLEFLKTR